MRYTRFILIFFVFPLLMCSAHVIPFLPALTMDEQLHISDLPFFPLLYAYELLCFATAVASFKVALDTLAEGQRGMFYELLWGFGVWWLVGTACHLAGGAFSGGYVKRWFSAVVLAALFRGFVTVGGLLSEHFSKIVELHCTKRTLAFNHQ